MRQRLITMTALWIIVGTCLGLGGVLGGQALLLAVALAVMWEFAHLLQKIGFKVNPLALLLGLALGLGGHLWGQASIGTSLGLIVIIAAHWQASTATLPVALGSVIAVGVGLGSLNSLAHLPPSYFSVAPLWIVVWVIVTIKLSDAGAYLIGSQLGKRAVLPNISPGKTLEGFIGVIIAGIIMGVMGAPLFYNPWLGLALGPVLAIFGSIGDLLESLLKRRAGVKDSGRTLPGIGGLLDLCDSLILAAPIAYLFILFLGNLR